MPDADPGVTDGAVKADVTAPTALEGDGTPLGVEIVCDPIGGVLRGGVFTGGVWIGGTVTVGVLSVGVLSVGVVMLGVLTVGVVIGPMVIEGTVTAGTLTEGTVTDGTDTVGSGGRTEEIDGSASRDPAASGCEAELPRAAAADSAAPASRAAHATSAVNRRRVIYPRSPLHEIPTIACACHLSPHDLSTSALTPHTGPPTRPESRTRELTTPLLARRR